MQIFVGYARHRGGGGGVRAKIIFFYVSCPLPVYALSSSHLLEFVVRQRLSGTSPSMFCLGGYEYTASNCGNAHGGGAHRVDFGCSCHLSGDSRTALVYFRLKKPPLLCRSNNVFTTSPPDYVGAQKV